MEDDISLIYEELETISKQEWSKLEKEAGWTKIRLFLLAEATMIVKFESTSSIQSKRKPERLHQNQLKLLFTNLPIIIDNVPI